MATGAGTVRAGARVRRGGGATAVGFLAGAFATGARGAVVVGALRAGVREAGTFLVGALEAGAFVVEALEAGGPEACAVEADALEDGEEAAALACALELARGARLTVGSEDEGACTSSVSTTGAPERGTSSPATITSSASTPASTANGNQF